MATPTMVSATRTLDVWPSFSRSSTGSRLVIANPLAITTILAIDCRGDMSEWLPFSTAYDPTEDPPGSVDPLGTLSEAERLADILLPGFTGRMWRPRLLTFSSVASVIADRAVRVTGREADRLRARLLFERLFVAAVVRLSQDYPEDYRDASSRLPGRRLAERAWREGEPLRAANFLKGQAVNGPFGVMSRLARAVGLLDADGRPGRCASDLVLAWAGDQDLPYFMEDPRQADGEGIRWAKRVTETVVHGLGKTGEWPSRNQQVWEMLASKLRPDGLSAGKERRAITVALNGDAIRQRMFELLRAPKSLEAYRESGGLERGIFERRMLLEVLVQLLKRDHPVDGTIAFCVQAIDWYERGAAVMQQVFDALLWGLQQKSGHSKPEEILEVPDVAQSIGKATAKCREICQHLERIIDEFKDAPVINAAARRTALQLIHDDVLACAASQNSAVSAVMQRHQRVQAEKRKATWVDCGAVWTLMPGRGIDAERPPEYRKTFLHPMRIQNGFSFLRDLGLARVADLTPTNEN